MKEITKSLKRSWITLSKDYRAGSRDHLTVQCSVILIGLVKLHKTSTYVPKYSLTGFETLSFEMIDIIQV